jgi:hypothetical protein
VLSDILMTKNKLTQTADCYNQLQSRLIRFHVLPSNRLCSDVVSLFVLEFQICAGNAKLCLVFSGLILVTSH